MSVLYGLYNDDGKPPHISDTLSIVYNSLARVGWAVAVSWVIVACATGHGGKACLSAQNVSFTLK